MLSNAPTALAVKAAMRKKGYVVFGDQKKGYDLNIFGIRTEDMSSNRFNDVLGVMYLSDGDWNCFMFPGTTDPGLYWRQNPMNVKGTAMLKPNQWRSCWTLGKHHGEYEALVQAKPLTVYRDADRDAVLEPDESKLDTGMFGINIHHASATGASTEVNKWSAGCQVFAEILHFNFFMTLVKKSAALHGPNFSYTLLEEADFAS